MAAQPRAAAMTQVARALVARQSSTAVAPDAVNTLISDFEDKLSAVGPQSVLIQLGLMIVLSVATVAAFCVLRPQNRLIYAPKSKYYVDPRTKPPDIGRGTFAWLKPLWTIKEDALFETIGLDGVTFLRFFRLSIWIFLVVTVLVVGVLLPANVIYNFKEVPSNRRNALSMMTIVSVQGNLLYLHVAITYVINIVVCGLLFLHTRRMLALKLRYFRSPEYQENLFARSLMISQIQSHAKSDQTIEQVLESARVPYPVAAVNIGRSVGDLPDLIEKHTDAVKQLEQVLTTYLMHPDKPLPKRPMSRKGGFAKMGGEHIDAIDYLTQRIHNLEMEIESARENNDSKRALNYGWASFAKVPYAHLVAKGIGGKRIKGAKVQLAPTPADIIWSNLVLTDAQRRSARFFIGIVLGIAICAYTVPLIAISFLSNLAAITVWVPFLKTWSDNSDFTFSAVSGILPPLLAFLLQLLLPWMIRKLSRKQGPITRTKLEHMVMARYFAFLVISQFLIFSMIGVVFNIVTEVIVDVNQHLSFSEVIDNLSKVPANIQSTYVRQSNYWLTWYSLQGFNSTFQIAQLLNLLWVWFRTRTFGRTPREIREWTAPQPFTYAEYYANSLFMVTVGLIYAPLAPLVALFAAAAFVLSFFVFKYQLLYVCITKIETGGRFWWMVANRILISLVFMQLLMILTIGLQRGWIKCIAAVPPILFVIGFKFWLRRYYPQWRYYTPDDAEIAASREHQSDAKKNRLARRFGHPALHAPLITPMLHAKCQQLLPQVYRGRIEATTVDVEGKEQQGVNAGGIQFAAMDQSQLELSREEFMRLRRQEDNWETASQTSTAIFNDKMAHTGGRGSYSSQQRQQYLASGPGARQMAMPFNHDDFDMRGRESQENLMRTIQWQNQQWQREGQNGTPGGSPHNRSESDFTNEELYDSSRRPSRQSYGHLPNASVESLGFGQDEQRASVNSRQIPLSYPPPMHAPSYTSAPPSRRPSIEDLLEGYQLPPRR